MWWRRKSIGHYILRARNFTSTLPITSRINSVCLFVENPIIGRNVRFPHGKKSKFPNGRKLINQCECYPPPLRTFGSANVETDQSISNSSWVEVKVPVWKEHQVADWKQIWVPDWVKMGIPGKKYLGKDAEGWEYVTHDLWRKKMIWKPHWKKVWRTEKKQEWVTEKKLQWKEEWVQEWHTEKQQIWLKEKKEFWEEKKIEIVKIEKVKVWAKDKKQVWKNEWKSYQVPVWKEHKVPVSLRQLLVNIVKQHFNSIINDFRSGRKYGSQYGKKFG